MIVIVTYDLNQTGKDYTPFFDALKQQGSWWHYLKSTWLISTKRTPAQIWEAVAPHMVTTDRILIVPMGDPYTGWLPKDAWEWIKKQKSA